MVVVLPAPLSPRKAKTAPRGTRRSSPSRAGFPRYRTTSRSVTITSSGISYPGPSESLERGFGL